VLRPTYVHLLDVLLLRPTCDLLLDDLRPKATGLLVDVPWPAMEHLVDVVVTWTSISAGVRGEILRGPSEAG
jgi:hypothetical protein